MAFFVPLITMKITLGYPPIDDPKLQSKITVHSDFRPLVKPREDLKGKTVEEILSAYADKPFEVEMYQLFPRQFMSFHSPYNGLLLFHGVGVGKTCGALQFCENMQEYYSRMNMKRKIYIISNSNIEQGYRKQIFNSKKLKMRDGAWYIDDCLGTTILEKINADELESSHEVTRAVENYVQETYVFMGYEKFTNHVMNIAKVKNWDNMETNEKIKKRISEYFNYSTVVIDEVHNIRYKSDTTINVNKYALKSIIHLARHVAKLKLLFLSATPIYNDPSEIIALINILRMNDHRNILLPKNFFDSDGNMITDKRTGKTLLAAYCRGYISYVKGENPFKFPYRLYPIDFAPEYSGKNKYTGSIDTYITTVSKEQQRQILEYMKTGKKNFIDQRRFIQLLTICYPETGIGTVVQKDPVTAMYTYVSKYKGFFEKSTIVKYSAKINAILECISKAKGIVLIFSSYIENGILPIALALEEMGYRRYVEGLNLLKTKSKPNGMKYSMITGDNNFFSPLDVRTTEINMLNAPNNLHGHVIKIVLISTAGSEGIDLHNIRQVHIVDPWYNISRTEQIIGRAVRYQSHKALPFSERNVEIYMHASNMPNSSLVAYDVEMYRICETKLNQIGKVTRILKKSAVDCRLNKFQHDYTADTLNMKVTLDTSSGKKIKYSIGDKPGTAICDYLETCDFECDTPEDTNGVDTINENDSTINIIIERITEMFRISFYYKRIDLVKQLIESMNVSSTQVEAAIDVMMFSPFQRVYDMYGRIGHVVRIGDYYLFQPKEIHNKRITTEERRIPIDFHTTDFIPMHHKFNNSISTSKSKSFFSISNERSKSKSPDSITIRRYRADTDKEWSLRLMTYMQEMYELACSTKKAIPKITNPKVQYRNWYLLYRYLTSSEKTDVNVANILHNYKPKESELKNMVLDHIFEQLNFFDTMLILNILFYGDPYKPFKKYYMDNHVWSYNKNMYTIISKDNNYAIVHIDKSELKILNPKDYYSNNIPEFIRHYAKRFQMKSSITGFYEFIPKENIFVFKMQNTSMSKNGNNKGFRCIQQGKANNIRTLNTIGTHCKRHLNYAIPPKVINALNKEYMCALSEILLRLLDMRSKTERYFFRPYEFKLAEFNYMDD